MLKSWITDSLLNLEAIFNTKAASQLYILV